jgi:Cdc6-like AAA superfamily ATPase
MIELKINLEQRDYSKFGLIGNPFPYSGVPDESPAIYVGQENVMGTIGNVLSATISTGKSNHLIITGTYGNGKSHTLRYIKKVLSNRFSEKDTLGICVGEISHFSEGFLDIYSKFVYDLGYDFLKDRAEEFLGLVAREMLNEGLIDKEVSGVNGWEMIVKGDVLLSDVVPSAVVRLNHIVRFMDFSKAFLNLAYEDNSIDAWDWICGEGVDYLKRRQIGVIKSLDEKNAVKAFVSLKNTLKFLNYSTVILLIDEFENVESLQNLAKQRTLNTIRHFIDMNPEGLSTIIACTPEVWQSFTSEYHAFSERIEKEANLKPLDKQTVQKLMIEYLNIMRESKNNSLKPFTEDSLDILFQLSQGNTRRILVLCSQLLDLCVDLGRSEIDGVFISSISKK